MFVIGVDTEKCSSLEGFHFSSEGTEKLSPQYILHKFPEILLSTEDLSISPFEKVISIREYGTSRGSIDIVYITDHAEIFLVETKLLRNSESHRTVVAQAIDYAKAFSEESLDSLSSKMKKTNQSLDIFENQEYYESILHQNVVNGNYQVLIVGDNIHPNILGMVESIQSAPHLAFTINAISLNPYSLNGDEIILFPRLITRTIEIERSVISIEVTKDGEIKVGSSVPEKKGQGNKPKITGETFLNNLDDTSYIEAIKHLWKEIEKRGGTIDWGTAGFSAGYHEGKRRVSLIWVYDYYFNILSERVRQSYGLSDELYNEYLKRLKESELIYEKIVVPNKASAHFDQIDVKGFIIVVDATLDLMDKLMAEN